MPCSPYVVYIDETGDRGLEKISAHSPVFVLCAAVYKIDDYLGHEQKALGRMKFNLWWHDNIVLHSYKIRKKVKPFDALVKQENQDKFNAEMASFFRASKAKLIAAGINKPLHKQQYHAPVDPYFLATQFVLERIYGHVRKSEGDTTCIFEARGDADDKRLEEVFNMICAPTGNQWGKRFPFRVQFAPKAANLAGLQVADLAAYPISKYVEDANTTRPDWAIVKPLIRTSWFGKMEGYGLKVFPPKAEGA